MNVETLQDLFLFDLNRVYGIETRLVDELAELERDADVDTIDRQTETAPRKQLKDVLAEHRSETETHCERLESAFEALDHRPREERTTSTVDAIVGEKERFNNVILNDEIRPLYYLGTAAEIERLEIGLYERLLRLAEQLDLPADVIDPLEANLDEERATLSTIEETAESDDVVALVEGIRDATE